MPGLLDVELVAPELETPEAELEPTSELLEPVPDPLVELEPLPVELELEPELAREFDSDEELELPLSEELSGCDEHAVKATTAAVSNRLERALMTSTLLFWGDSESDDGRTENGQRALTFL